MTTSYYRLLFFLITVFCLTSCGVKGNVVVQQPVAISTISAKQQDLVAFSKRFLRTPYRFGGRGPSAFDCSGFTMFVFKEFGYTLNASSAAQDTQFPTISNKHELQIGDLVFFEGRARNGRVGHAGIVTETYSNGYFRFIHATTSAGVIVSSSAEPYYSVRYLRGGRVLQNDPNYVSHQQQTHTDNTQTTETQQTHTVKAGETLFSISRQYNTTVEQIRQWNPQLGEVLRIDEVLTINNQSVSAPTTTNQAQQTHTVKTGETLFSISQRYNTTVGQLRRWNPQLGEILRVGEVLIVRR